MRKIILICLCLAILVGCKDNDVESSNKNLEDGSVLGKEQTDIDEIDKVKLEIPEGRNEYEESQVFTFNQLEADFEIFSKVFESLVGISDGDSFDAESLLSEAKSKLVENMTDGEFELVLRQLLAKINNNDIKIAPSWEKENFIASGKSLFPVDILFLNKSVFINEESDDKSLLVGDKVLSINSLDIKDIVYELSRLTSFNSNSFAMDYNLTNEFKLLFFEKYGEYGSYQVEIDREGTKRKVSVDGKVFEGLALSAISKDAGLKTEKVNYKNEEYGGNKVSYLRMGTVLSGDSEAYFNDLDVAISEINNYKPLALILDFSNNRTIDPEIIRGIFSRFINDDTVFYYYGEGDLMKPVKSAKKIYNGEYSLMFDNRSSAAVNQLVETLSRTSNQKTAGVNTSSGTIAYNDFEIIELENTGIRIKYPKSILKVLGEVELYELGLSPSEYKSDIVFRGYKQSVLEFLYNALCSV